MPKIPTQFNHANDHLKSLDAELKRDRYLFYFIVYLGLIAIGATVWGALK